VNGTLYGSRLELHPNIRRRIVPEGELKYARGRVAAFFTINPCKL
jgi:hypothetical protein